MGWLLPSNLDAMEPIKEPETPNLEETQPIQRVKPRVRPWMRWVIFTFTCLVFLGAVVVLALPSLARPPATGTEPYEFFPLTDSSEVLDPSVDHLVMSSGDHVAVYIPQGSDLGPGQFLILERRPEFVPIRIDAGTERLNAVDLLILRPDGELDGDPVFDSSILLCFFLNEEQAQDQSEGFVSFAVQSYSESQAGAEWTILDPSPGWQEDQVCTALHHLSLYALARTSGISDAPTPSPTPEESLPKDVPLPELYGFPTQAP